MKKLLPLSVLFFFFSLEIIHAQDLAGKANTFLSMLSKELRAEAHFELKDDERLNMHFVPIERKGPTFHDFNEKQKQAALALLRASLSETGYTKTLEIMELEKVLVIIEKNERKFADGSPIRDPLNYHFCIFGEPSSRTLWGWRFEGHHISLNFFSKNGSIVSSTPTFFGSNPGIVGTDLQKGKQVLKQETELGFQLVNSLNEVQLKEAMIQTVAPEEIITGNNRKAKALEPKGIPFTSLDGTQQKVLKRLLQLYVDNYTLGFSKTLMNKIETAGIENLTFAWAGSLKPGIANYYRIQGPMLLIEYDNSQNNANHIHTTVRDLTNDFAEDILREHYEKEHETGK